MKLMLLFISVLGVRLVHLDNGIILTQLGVEFTENIIFLHCLTINSPTLTWMSEKYIGANGEEYRFATIHDVGEQRPLVVNQMTTSIANLTSRYRNENREWVLESILLVKVYASAGTGKSNVFCVHDNGTRKSVTIVPGGSVIITTESDPPSTSTLVDSISYPTFSTTQKRNSGWIISTSSGLVMSPMWVWKVVFACLTIIFVSMLIAL